MIIISKQKIPMGYILDWLKDFLFPNIIAKP